MERVCEVVNIKVLPKVTANFKRENQYSDEKNSSVRDLRVEALDQKGAKYENSYGSIANVAYIAEIFANCKN